MADEILTEDVIDLDVHSVSGATMSITLVPAKGDSWKEVGPAIKIVKGFETVTIYTQNVFYKSVRTRKRPLPVIPFKPVSAPATGSAIAANIPGISVT